MEETGSDAAVMEMTEHAAALVDDTGSISMSTGMLRAAAPDPGCTFERVTRPEGP